MTARSDTTVASVGRLLSDAALPAGEARTLLAAATGRTRESLVAHPEAVVAADAAQRFRRAVEARHRGVPIAYLVGRREFHGRDFAVSADVLVPRPETEHLVERALARLVATARPAGRRPRVLDLGTGSGAIAITLALEAPHADVTATDREAGALAVARSNATRLGATVAFARGDWFDALDPDEAPFDLIVSNPPYVAADDPHLAQGDLRFEPRGALTDGHDGLDAYRLLVPAARTWLAPDGWLLVEHGHDQAVAVRALYTAAGFGAVASTRDLAGIERVVEGRCEAGQTGRAALGTSHAAATAAL